MTKSGFLKILATIFFKNGINICDFWATVKIALLKKKCCGYKCHHQAIAAQNGCSTYPGARPCTTNAGASSSASPLTAARSTTTTDGRVPRCLQPLRRWASPKARRAFTWTAASWLTTTTWATSASRSSRRLTLTTTTTRKSSSSRYRPTTERPRPRTEP